MPSKEEKQEELKESSSHGSNISDQEDDIENEKDISVQEIEKDLDNDNKKCSKEMEVEQDEKKESMSFAKDEKNGEVVENLTKKTKTKKIWSQKEILSLSRKFNLDLTVKLLYSRGAMVELLISSNVARYAEFKCTSRILTWMKDTGLTVVPCSRSEVFTSTVSLIEKRLLMKFLELCHKYEENKSIWEGKIFIF